MTWQPIETAPRDGWPARFLAMDETGWIFIAHFGGTDDKGDQWLDDSFDCPYFQPVEWMPLPAPAIKLPPKRRSRGPSQ